MTDTGAVSGETPDEFEVLEPARSRVVQLQGKDVDVRPLTIGQAPRFSRALRPAMEPLMAAISAGMNADNFKIEVVIDLIEQHGDELREAAAVAIGMSGDDISDAPLDEFIELVVAVFAVNLDFFVQRLLPKLAGNADGLARHLAQVGGSGRTRSSSSNGKGTH